MPDNATTACCQNILVPVNVWPVRELNHEAIFHRTRNDWSLIELAGAPSNMSDDRERSEGRTCEHARDGIQGVLENDKEGITELPLKSHRACSVSNFSKTAVVSRSKL